MKVKDLVEKLLAMPQDLEVYSMCDHGQSPEKAGIPSIAYTENLDHSLWDEWTSLEVDAFDYGYKQRFVLY